MCAFPISYNSETLINELYFIIAKWMEVVQLLDLILTRRFLAAVQYINGIKWFLSAVNEPRNFVSVTPSVTKLELTLLGPKERV